MRRINKFLLQKLKFVMMLVGIIILALLVRSIGWSRLVDIVSGMSIPLVLLALLPWVITLALGAYRLKLLARTDIPLFDIFTIYIYSYLLNYASAIQGVGTGAKIGLLRMKKISIAKSSASISLEIFYDLLLTVLVSLVFFAYHITFVLEKIRPLVNTSLFVLAGILAAGACMLLFIMRKNPHVVEFMAHFMHAFTWKRFVRFFPITAVIWVMPSLMTLLFFKAAGFDVSFMLALSAVSLAFVLGLFSLIPGGLGVRDAIMAYVYLLSGIPLDITISISLFNRVFTIGVTFLIMCAIKLPEFLAGRKKENQKQVEK